MDFNKVAAGILCAGVVFVASFVIAEGIFSPDKLEKQAYIIDTGMAETANSETESKPAYLTGADFDALVNKGDIAKGETIFKKCIACHSNDKGGANKVGPNLWDIFEHDIASNEGYKYSDGLKVLEGNWTIEHLNGWLYSPRDYVKGNRMGFAGIKDNTERANIIAYLKTLR
jgi:cytochrome c